MKSEILKDLYLNMEKAHHEIANIHIFCKTIRLLKRGKCIWSTIQKDQVTYEGQRIKLENRLHNNNILW